jgi:hypothetical protein
MFTTKVRTTLAVLAAAIGIMSLGPAGSANAASLSAKLTLTPNGRSYQSVDVTGVVKGTSAEIDQYVKNDYRVVFNLWGEDTFFDDHLLGPSPASVQVTSKGLEFHGKALVQNSLLNEDWGQDEVYAGVKLVKSTSYVNGKITHGPTVVSGKSNVISRSF